MASLTPTGLETITYGQQGWNAIVTANMQRFWMLRPPDAVPKSATPASTRAPVSTESQSPSS